MPLCALDILVLVVSTPLLALDNLALFLSIKFVPFALQSLVLLLSSKLFALDNLVLLLSTNSVPVSSIDPESSSESLSFVSEVSLFSKSSS